MKGHPKLSTRQINCSENSEAKDLQDPKKLHMKPQKSNFITAIVKQQSVMLLNTERSRAVLTGRTEYTPGIQRNRPCISLRKIIKMTHKGETDGEWNTLE